MSRHSSDNTQYYANKPLCDSGATDGVGHMALLTADQLAYVPYASLSAACLPLFPIIPSTSDSPSADSSPLLDLTVWIVS